MRFIITLLVVLLVIPSALAFDLDVVKTDPAPIVAGEYADITVIFENGVSENSDFDNLLIELEETRFILPVESTFTRLNNVGAGETVTGTIRAYFSEELPQGYINLVFLISSDTLTAEENVTVFIEDSQRTPELYVGAIQTSPSELLPDTENNKLTVTLQNLGDKDAELVRAELIPGSEEIKSSYSYSLIDSVASIAGGSEANLEFNIDLEENAKGVINSTLLLRYRAEKAIGNTYDIFEEELPLLVEVTDSPLLFVQEVKQLDGFAIGSTENKLRIVITNEGLEDAEEVRIRMVPDISYPFSFEQTTEYVTSRIEPGESAEVEFKVEVLGSGEARNYSTTVILESLVSDTRYTREDSVGIEVSEKRERDNSSFGTYFLGFIIVVSIILGYIIWRRNKKTQKKSKK